MGVAAFVPRNPRLVAAAAATAAIVFASLDRATAQEGPDGATLASHIAMELPPFWDVTSVTVTAEVNDGDAVNPEIRQRFEAVATPRQALYVGSEGELPPPFVRARQTLDAGDERTLYGTSQAIMAAGAWRIAIMLESDVASLGQPEALFAGPIVMQGSAREQEIVAAARDDVLRTVRGELEQAVAAMRRAHETEIEALTARHADALDALRQRQAEALRRAETDHAARLEAERVEFEQRRESIMQETEQKAEILRTEVEAAHSLTALTRERDKNQAALAEARAAARANEAARLAADMESLSRSLGNEDATLRRTALLTALEEEDPRLRGHAIAVALKAADDEMQANAIVAGLAAPNPLLRSAALDAALATEDPALRAMAAANVLAERTSLTLRQDEGNGAALVLSNLEIEPQSGRLTGNIGGDGDFSRCRNEAVSGTVAESGIGLAGNRCTLDLTFGPDGALTGTFVAQDRYRHAVVGSLR